MNIIDTELEEIKIIEPSVFEDERGFFMETYHKKRYQTKGILPDFCQNNYSFSAKGTLRGMHYQFFNTQAKLIQVLQGEVYDVALDVRYGSPTFGKWVGVWLSEKNCRQLFIPQGFAHGFCVTSETAMFTYQCDDYYNPDAEEGILWSDTDIGIDWPIASPVLSKKDSEYQCLQKIPVERLPVYVHEEQ
jgi:dTDP-4-dehydrorhamnose 3,5-epimerase